MASIRDCIGIINEAVGDAATPAEKEKLLNKLAKQVTKEKAISKEADMEQKLKQWLADESTKEEVAAAIEQRQRLLNIQAKERIFSHLSNFKDRALGLRALLGGTMQYIKSSRRSVDAIGKAHSTRYVTNLIRHLEEEDVFEEFVSGKIDDHIARELYEIKPGGKSGASGNPAAEKIARIIFEQQDRAISANNRHGAWIRKLPDYIMRQSHNPVKIRRDGFEKWYNSIIDTVDMDRTMANIDVDDMKAFWKNVYNGLITGIHLKHRGEDFADDIIKGFTGPSNLAKRMSEAHRIIHFKDSDAFMKYNRAYGTKTLRETIVLSLDHFGKNQALLEVLGPNPRAMLESIVDSELRSAKARGDIKAMEEFGKMSRGKNDMLWHLMAEVDGTTRIPGDVRAAHISSTVRNIQNMAKLGMATLSSITDIPNQVAELKYQGINRFKGYSIALENLFKGRGMKKSDRRAVAQMLGVGMDGIIGNTISRFSSDDLTPGMFAKAQQAYFKLNLLSPWTDSHRVGSTLMMSRHLAMQADKTFDKLDPHTKRILEIYDMGKLEWENIISKAIYKGQDGQKYIVTDMIENLDDATILSYLKQKEPIVKKHSKSKIARERDRLVSSLAAYYVDRADFAVPMPSAYERAYMNRGTQDGTLLGVAARLFWQFKSFPVTVLHKSLGREIYGHGASSFKEGLLKGKASYTGMAHFIVSTSLLGYLSLYLKDIARGKEPRKFNDDMAHNIKIISAAMAQGGGLGLYGDFLFGSYNKYGGSALATLMGPSIGQFDSVVQILQAIRTGDDPFAKLANLIQGNTPFINLFYLRMVLDYLVLYNIKEWQNPGYLKRMERRLKKEHDQGFYIPPSRVIKRGGDNPINIIENMISEMNR